MKPHTEQTKTEAIRRVQMGETKSGVAKSLGIAHDTVCRWTKPAPQSEVAPGMDWFLYRRSA